MLHRQETEGIIVISQPAHAWLSGQMARSWGNQKFTPLSEEVCLAAEQHDIGFLQWEQFPTLNPETGLPFTFMEMPTAVHLDIWTTGIEQMIRFGRYPALLVSLHFTSLAKRHDKSKTPEDKQLVAKFLDAQDALQTTLQTSLLNDFYYAPSLTDQVISHDQQIVSLLDWMSLLLCFGLREDQLIKEFPTNGDSATLTLHPLNADASQVAVSPWPFHQPSVNLICDGRRLLKTFASEQEMREALKAAAPLTLRFTLSPG